MQCLDDECCDTCMSMSEMLCGIYELGVTAVVMMNFHVNVSVA